jgi:hypothetical protein
MSYNPPPSAYPVYNPAVSMPAYGGSGGRSLVPIHRFYHQGHLDHFYSANITEGTPNGYSPEGVAFQLSSTQAAGLVPVYRYWRADVKDHFYSTNGGEIGVIHPGATGKHGYVCEGVLGYISPVSMPGTTPVYRYFKEASNDHFYTTNGSEIGAVVSGTYGNLGYMCEGVLGYAFI